MDVGGARSAAPRLVRARALALPVWRLWPWLPLVFAGVYLVVLLADFRSLVQAMYFDSDAVSAPYLGELYRQAPPDAQVVLGYFPWYTTLWFEQLTHSFPAHRQLWQVAPWIVSLAGVGLVAWSTTKAAGRWAGAIVAVLLVCASPGLLKIQFVGNSRAPTFATICLLGAFLVLCASRGGTIGRPLTHGLVCVALALIAAVGFASDKVMAVGGILPFVLAGLAMPWLLARSAGWRIAVSTTLIGAGALGGGAIARHAMEVRHVIPARYTIDFAAWDQIFPNLRVLGQALAFLFNGDFAGKAIDGRSLTALACAVALVVGGAIALRFGWSWARTEIGSMGGGPRPAGGRPAALSAHLAFWLLAGVLLGLAFVLSTVPMDIFSSRYVVTVAYAIVVVVTVALLVRRPAARALLVVATCVIVGANIASLLRRDLQDGAKTSHFPTGTVSGPLLRLAREEHIKYGYAGYWDAAPLSWQMKTEVQLYPVIRCGAGTLCPFWLHLISSWYHPRPNTRTMLVIDGTQSAALAPTSAPPRMGRPDRVVNIGQLTMYIYPYDIASRFGT